MNADTRPQRNNEEPEIAFEESIPLDGRDPVGEQMIEDLGRKQGKYEKADKVPPQPPAEPMPEQLPVS
ncbi:hypothetical protein [Variovorax sp. KK3]|uniref:hypothetical protein n=1 Tax=Variovorax sp. KK3 TaxID=1855728 RepID=UPI00097C5252|nr:hypothetical protein [Variovorax sp. KK3]